jgi:hypothetical protein
MYVCMYALPSEHKMVLVGKCRPVCGARCKLQSVSTTKLVDCSVSVVSTPAILRAK